MKIYRKGTGEKYTPFNHYGMTTQVVFNPDTGSKRVNFTLSTIPKGAGSVDEVHEKSDQIFYIIKGELKISANGKLVDILKEGDAALVEAGDVHAVINDGEEDCVFCCVTVPPLDKTH
ncbi:MAG: cupin domain-containing protein [Bacillota bacterium]